MDQLILALIQIFQMMIRIQNLQENIGKLNSEMPCDED